MNTTDNLKNSLVYPFKDPMWMQKVAIAVLLACGGMIIPLIPSLLFMGYLMQIMTDIIVENKSAALPDWTDWGGYLKQGIKLFGVKMVYTLPGVILLGLTIGLTFVLSFAMPFLGESLEREPFLLLLLFFSVFGIIIVTNLISTILLGLGYIMVPPAVCRIVQTGRFTSAFEISGWWQIVRKNVIGFVVVTLMLLGMASLLYVAFYWTYFFVFCCAAIIVVWMAVGVYFLLVASAAYASAYRQAMDAQEHNSGGMANV